MIRSLLLKALSSVFEITGSRFFKIESSVIVNIPPVYFWLLSPLINFSAFSSKESFIFFRDNTVITGCRYSFGAKELRISAAFHRWPFKKFSSDDFLPFLILDKLTH